MDYLWRSLGYTTTSSNGAGAATEPTDIPAAATEVAATERPDWTKMMTGGCPVVNKGGSVNEATPAEAEASIASETTYNPKTNMMVEERQRPSVGQITPLPTNRQRSNIPKGDITPGHQEEGAAQWEYPSQQMFFNAMKRKGHGPKESEMSTVVGMHNAVNERSWGLLMEWEKQLHPETADSVRLLKFAGDSKKFSPKARFRELLGYSLPFDRHDWTVTRGDEEVRYVIDFYTGQSEAVGIHIDVRPAIDSPTSFLDRIKMGFIKLQREAPLLSTEKVNNQTTTTPPEQK